MKCLVLLVCFLNMSIAYAHTWGTKEVVCPLGGEKFQTTVDMSGTRFGMQLDLKPLGPIAAPWRLPVCPSNHFVVYKDTEDFTDDEIRHLETYIQGTEYQMLAKTNTSYFLLGKIFEYEGRTTPEELAYVYLQASWQAESPEQYLRAAQESLKNYQLFLRHAHEDTEETKVANIVIGELQRRLGQFDAAARHFESLQTLPAFQSELLAEIVSYELELIGQKDQAPHPVPAEDRP